MKIIDDSIVGDRLGEVLKFRSAEDLADPSYTLYAWIARNTNDENAWNLKFGMARKTVQLRLSRETAADAENHVVGLWKSKLTDGPIHEKLKLVGKTSSLFDHFNDGLRKGTMSEVYKFKTFAGLQQILSIIDEVVGSKGIKKKTVPLFADIKKLVDEVSADSSEKFALDLCTRWGKTRTALELMLAGHEKFGTKVSVMLSYVGTAKKSYADEIAMNLCYDNLKLVCTDDNDNCDAEISSWLEDSSHHVLYYLALTGDEDKCFKNRLAPLLKLKCKMDMYVDEVDFGAKCPLQISKIHKLWSKCKFVKFYGMTGTNAESIKSIWPNEKLSVYKRDYIIDVLNAAEREEAVNISWHVLDNTSLAEAVGSTAAMENFSDMCDVVDGHLKEETYFEQLLRWLYVHEAPFDPRKFRAQAKAKLVDPDFATMVFLPNDKSCHSIFAKLVERNIPGTRAVVVNGDETTNAEAEELVKRVIDDNALCKGMKLDDPHRGAGVFIIAAGMANRSFSVKEIKNILLLVNGGEYWSIAQKVARGFTPFRPDERQPFTENDPRKMCNVIDFRLAWQWPKLSAWLSGLGIEAMSDDHTTEDDPFKIITEITASTSKITFDEYKWEGAEPVRKLSEEDLLVMMQTNDFRRQRMCHLADMDSLPEPIRCELNEDVNVSLPSSGNVKGDSCRKHKKLKLASSKSKDIEDGEAVPNPVDWKLQHLNFIWNHKDWLSTPGCKTVDEALEKMSAERKALYEKTFGIDMTFIELLVKHLKEKVFVLEFSEAM